MSARHDRFGDRIDDDEPTLFTEPASIRIPPAVPPPDVCILCGRPLAPGNLSQIDDECRLIVRNVLNVAIEERWRDHPDGEHVVSDRGRIARLLHVDRAHRYPRVRHRRLEGVRARDGG